MAGLEQELQAGKQGQGKENTVWKDWSRSRGRSCKEVGQTNRSKGRRKLWVRSRSREFPCLPPWWLSMDWTET